MKSFSVHKIKNVIEKNPTQPNEKKLSITKGTFEVEQWLIDNIAPEDLKKDYINKSPAVTGLTKYKAKLVYGMGVYPLLVKSIDPDGDLTGEPCTDIELIRFCNSPIIHKLFFKGALNMFHYGFPFIELILNLDKSKIVDINIIDSYWGRWGIKNDNNIIENAVFGDWVNGSPENFKSIPVLSILDPLQDLIDRSKTSTSFIYPLTFTQEYYPHAGWHSAMPWVKIDREAPTYIQSFYDNSLGVTYIVKVPKIWVNTMWPINESRTEQQQETLFDEWIDTLKTELTGSVNHHKIVANQSITDENGQEIWITIEQLKSEVKFDKELVTGKMADDKIATAENLGNAVILDATNGSGMNSGSEKKSQANIDQSLIQTEWVWLCEVLNLIRDFNKMPKNLMFLRKGNIFVNDDKNASGILPDNKRTNTNNDANQ